MKGKSKNVYVLENYLAEKEDGQNDSLVGKMFVLKPGPYKKPVSIMATCILSAGGAKKGIFQGLLSSPTSLLGGFYTIITYIINVYII